MLLCIGCASTAFRYVLCCHPLLCLLSVSDSWLAVGGVLGTRGTIIFHSISSNHTMQSPVLFLLSMGKA